MENTFESLSKEELIALLQGEKLRVSIIEKNNQHALVDLQKKEQIIHQKDTDITYLKARIAQLERMLFGQKRERFENPDQLTLPFETPSSPEQDQKQEEILVEQKKVLRKKHKETAHKSRNPLPDHLPVVEVEIHPEGDLSQMVCIGKEVTEELDCEPARYFIRRYIRYKYAAKDQSGVCIGQLPSRVIDKGIPSASLLSGILVDKYMDHLPLYRQKQRMARENIHIPESTIGSWVQQGLDKLEILYQRWQVEILSKGYLQVDETTINVLDSDKKGASHRGYYWVAYSPIDRATLFMYQPGRSEVAMNEVLQTFKGYMQTDGYEVYNKKKEVKHLCCWAHVRRKFESALSSDPVLAGVAMSAIQSLYAQEEIARVGQYTAIQRKEHRLSKALPIINELGKWIAKHIQNTLPKSQIGKAMHYAFSRWDQLSLYLEDGSLEIDNNLVENVIRPIPLGRKNYLFAGSHESAQRAAMIYTFFANCKSHGVNPNQWLKYVLENIMDTNHKELGKLYPQNFNQQSPVM